jgi:hypothetical protein
MAHLPIRFDTRKISVSRVSQNRVMPVPCFRRWAKGLLPPGAQTGFCPSNLTSCVPFSIRNGEGIFPPRACSPFLQLGWGKGAEGIGVGFDPSWTEMDKVEAENVEKKGFLP